VELSPYKFALSLLKNDFWTTCDLDDPLSSAASILATYVDEMYVDAEDAESILRIVELILRYRVIA
jgi:hypothetical protein